MIASSEEKAATGLPSFNEVWERIRRVTGLRSQSELAEALGIKTPSVTGAKQRGSFPLEWAYRLAQKYEVSLDMLLTAGAVDRCFDAVVRSTPVDLTQRPGRLTRPASADDVKARETPAAETTGVESFLLIPKVKARLSAGTGSLETNGDVAGRYAFREEWARSKGYPDKMVLMTITGDSMEPEIRNGDTVLIDQSQIEVIPGGIYAVGIDDAIVVKQLDVLPGKIVLKSFNPSYPPAEIDLRGDLGASCRIIGRVVWWCREAG